MEGLEMSRFRRSSTEGRSRRHGGTSFGRLASHAPMAAAAVDWFRRQDSSDLGALITVGTSGGGRIIGLVVFRSIESWFVVNGNTIRLSINFETE